MSAKGLPLSSHLICSKIIGYKGFQGIFLFFFFFFFSGVGSGSQRGSNEVHTKVRDRNDCDGSFERVLL